jgi:Domain of unknown function (DUF1772)
MSHAAPHKMVRTNFIDVDHKDANRDSLDRSCGDSAPSMPPPAWTNALVERVVFRAIPLHGNRSQCDRLQPALSPKTRAKSTRPRSVQERVSRTTKPAAHSSRKLLIAACLAGASFWWAIAGVLSGSVMPFTVVAILPTNKRLLSPAPDRRSAEAERLLSRWGGLHAVRSVLSGVALLIFLYLAIFKKPL